MPVIRDSSNKEIEEVGWCWIVLDLSIANYFVQLFVTN